MLFKHRYQRTMLGSRAPWFPAGLSCAESSYFPIPPDAMLAPMNLAMAPGPFAAASTIGRGARFSKIAGLLARGGPRMQAMLAKYVEWIGWAVVGAVVAYLILRG